MSSKKKLSKGIESIKERIKEHEIKLSKATSKEGIYYLTKDIERLKKQKHKKEKRIKSGKIDEEIEEYRKS
ncbi:MAG: hypothetical protein Q7S21_01285 [archaeon]|nr:hypothetical protein [archaeon]